VKLRLLRLRLNFIEKLISSLMRVKTIENIKSIGTKDTNYPGIKIIGC
jgi:hypothetical protein